MAGQSSPQKVRHIQGPISLKYTSGGTDSQPVPGGMLLREILLRMKFVVTTSANMAAAAIAAGAQWGLIKVIALKAGTEVIREYSGEELRVLNMYWYRRGMRPRIALGATGTTVEDTLILPLWDPLARKPMDTALNTSAYANLRLEVQWNTHTNVASTATAFATAPILDWSLESSTGAPAAMKVLETRTQRLSVAGPAGATTDFAIPLQTGITAIRSLLIYAKDASSPPADAPGLITSFKLKALNTLILESTFAALRDQALHRAGLTELVASGAKSSLAQDAQFDLDNYCFLDFAKDGYLSESFPTFKLADLRLLLTTTAAVTTITVVQNFLIPPTNP